MVSVGCAHAAAGETLAQVKARGSVRCGVSEGIVGFSLRDDNGRWSGLEVDFCRALAAAVLGDASKVTFVALKPAARFPALRGSQIDVLLRNTTWTLAREAGLKVLFAGVLYYDGQGFIVPSASKIKNVAALKGAKVCVQKSTTSAQNLVDYSSERDLAIEPVVVDSDVDAAAAFFAGKCRALTADASQLAGLRLRAPKGPQSMVILPDRISREPLGPSVRTGDDDWYLIVRGVLAELVALEHAGVGKDDLAKKSGSRQFKHELEASDEVGRMLGINPGWVNRILSSVGNYGDMYERNLGAGSQLKLERGQNRLWTQGGLMYAPSVR